MPVKQSSNLLLDSVKFPAAGRASPARDAAIRLTAGLNPQPSGTSVAFLGLVPVLLQLLQHTDKIVLVVMKIGKDPLSIL